MTPYMLSIVKKQCREDSNCTTYLEFTLFSYLIFYKNVPSFPSHKAHRVALISVSLDLSQTPVYTARPWIWGYCIMWCAILRPSFSRYSLHLPTEGWPGWVDLLYTF